MAEAIGTLENMLFFPYNSEEDESGKDDRLYDSQDFADYFKQFLSDGVYPNPANGLKIESVDNSMVLTARKGSAFIGGRFYMQKKDFKFSVEPSHLTLERRDIVVCRHDKINRIMQLAYIKGVASSFPLAPEVTRTDDIHDLKLCEIIVPANTQRITQANIKDTRLDTSVCGIVHGLIEQVDTLAIFDSYAKAWEAAYADGEGRKEEFYNLLGGMETQLFALINNNFDDISTKRGCNLTTVFIDENNIEETITVMAENFILATRTTEFVDEDKIIETVNFFPFEIIEGNNTIETTLFEMTSTTIFGEDENGNDIIIEEVR